jgi:effector-binding domain-containing protein
MTGPALACYDDAPDGDGILVHAGVPVAGAEGRGDHPDLTIVELPEVERAATIIHRGDMDDVIPTIQALARWIDAAGYRSAGYNRELYIEIGPDRATWVTELQEPLEA